MEQTKEKLIGSIIREILRMSIDHLNYRGLLEIYDTYEELSETDLCLTDDEWIELANLNIKLEELLKRKND